MWLPIPLDMICCTKFGKTQPNKVIRYPHSKSPLNKINPYVVDSPVGGGGTFVGRTDIVRDVGRVLASARENAMVLYAHVTQRARVRGTG